MSRTIRRINRTTDVYGLSANVQRGSLDTEGVSNRYTPSARSNCCPPTLSQRVSILENEIADVNTTLAQHTCELNNHEMRIENLENANQNPCNQPGPYPFSDPYYPFRMAGPQDQSSGQYSNCNPCHNYPPNPGNECYPSPCHQSSRRPPIIFDGYSISYRQTSVNGTVAYFWYLIPESSSNTDVYRFSWRSTSNKYIYEPVDPNNYAIVYTASSSDSVHITYIYDNFPNYGWGLRPYLYVAASSSPHTIIGFQYIEVIFSNPSSNEWCYVPITQEICCDNHCPHESSKGCRDDHCCGDDDCYYYQEPFVRNIIFTYARTMITSGSVSYYNVVDPALTDPSSNITKFPINIKSATQNINIASEIAPFNSGVAFILPFDSNTYQISFSTEIKINTESVPVTPPESSINYLLGSPYSSANPAIAQLVVYQLNNNGVVINASPSAVVQSTWSDIIIDPSLPGPAPNNFKVFQESDIVGPGGTYYKTQISNINPTFTVVPVLAPNGIP